MHIRSEVVKRRVSWGLLVTALWNHTLHGVLPQWPYEMVNIYFSFLAFADRNLASDFQECCVLIAVAETSGAVL